MVVNHETLSKRHPVVTQVIRQLRRSYSVEIIRETELTEEKLIERIENHNPELVLTPLDSYRNWQKVHNFIRSNYTRAIRYAAYFTKPLNQYEPKDGSFVAPQIILNYIDLSISEIVRITRTLVEPNQSTGIQTLIDSKTQIYSDPWMGNEAPGGKLDHLMTKSEISNFNWNIRLGAIRILFFSFWALVYEEGRGKLEFIRKSPSQNQFPIAYFQYAIDSQNLWMRLIYSASHLRSNQDALNYFTQGDFPLSHPISLLFKYADFVRIHPLKNVMKNSSSLEITVGLFTSAPSEKGNSSLWLEATPSGEFIEKEFNFNQENLKNLSVFQIRELKAQLKEKDEKIRELRAGGVGIPTSLLPSDAEGLLEAFQERYSEAKYQIRQCELQIEKLRKNGAKTNDMLQIQQRIDALFNREKAWIRKLEQVLDQYKRTPVK